MRKLVVFLASVASLGCFAEEALNPMILFLAVSGRPTEADIARVVDSARQSGFDQFMIYPRSGLQYRYMGDEWLNCVETFCEEGMKRGMKVWLGDEYNWPSGTCKGRVPNETEQFRYREWAVYPKPGGGFEWENTLAPLGWVNLCDEGAVERFLDLTHRVYEKRLKRYFDAGVIAGVFTDEPGHPTAIKFRGATASHFPSWDGLEEEYRAATNGRDFRADVEAQLSGGGDCAVWETYAELHGRRFRKTYFDRIRRWCDKMGVASTGHMIIESSPKESVFYNGNPLHLLKGESLPGMDEICTHVGMDDPDTEWVTLGIVQHAATRAGNGALAELFACGPNDMPVARLRQMIWLTAMFNVDHYLVTLPVTDHGGLVEKHGYLAPIQFGQPWLAELKPSGFMADVARAAAFARRLDFTRSAAVRYPQKAAARAAYTKASAPALVSLLKSLSIRQFAFDLIEEDEKSDLPVVFSVVVEGERSVFVEERTGRRFESAELAAEWLVGNSNKKVWYLESDGSVAKGVIVREYPDGSSVALDVLNKEARELVVSCGGVKSTVRLESRGVVESPEMKSFECRFDRANLYRLPFSADSGCKVAKFTLAQPLKGVRLVLRDFAMSYAVTESGRPVDDETPLAHEKVFRHSAEPYSFRLDGAEAKGVKLASSLPVEFSRLYLETEPMDLSAGEHTLELVTGEGDRNYYLPAAFLAGNLTENGGALVELPRQLGLGSLKSQGLDSFCGAVTYCTHIPHGARFLRINSGGLVAKVSVGGRNLGTRAWAPFEWALAPEDGGKTAEITLFTSVVNMMGPSDRKDSDWDLNFWAPTRDPSVSGGLLSLEFIR